MARSITVLVADDQATFRDTAARVFRDAGYRVVLAIDGQDALDRAESEKPDLVILDVVMPRVSGIEVCKTLKKRASREGEFLPILFLSSRTEPAARVEGLKAGAEDYVCKPFDADELRIRVDGLLRTKQMFDEAVRGRSELEENSLHDRLTGLYNQRYLLQRVEEEFRRAERYNEPLSILALDLDEFEAVNGRYGRGTGDRLLTECGRTLTRACRQVDIVTRAGGGDEFVVVMPNTHFTSSLSIAESLWREIRGTEITEGASAISCASSIGVACYPNRDINSARDLLRFAHAALSRAKAEGRGKICLYQHQGYLFQPQ